MRIRKYRKLVLVPVVAALAATAGLAVTANAAGSPAAVRSGHNACVTHGNPNSALGNDMLYNWNDSNCPAGTYPASLAPIPVTRDLGGVASVATGGPFLANSTEAGTVTLKAGTYLLSVNAKATPKGGADPVFPQFFVYNQPKNAAFAGDLLNVGSGALAASSTSLDSYFSGATVITLASATTLHVYAFGYSADKAAGTYALDDLTVNAVPLG